MSNTTHIPLPDYPISPSKPPVTSPHGAKLHDAKPIIEQAISLVDQNNASLQDTLASISQFFTRFEGKIDASSAEGLANERIGHINYPSDDDPFVGASQRLISSIGQQSCYLNELHALVLRLSEVA